MASRLERIVALLETGSSPVVRQTAAKQLGDIAFRFFPTAEIKTESVKQELRHLTQHHKYARSTYEDGWANSVALVCRILPFLASKSMDTRLAAVDAINHIAEAVPLWYPEAQSENVDQVMSEAKPDPLAIRIQDVNVQALINSKSQLPTDSEPSAPVGKVSVKRRRLNTEPVKDEFLENLGIDSALIKSESLSDVDIDDEFDFIAESRSSSKPSSEKQAHIQDAKRKGSRAEKSPSRKRAKLEGSDAVSKGEINLSDGGQDAGLKPSPRRPGRPKGSKNKVQSTSLPSSPSGFALLPEDNDIFRGLSGRQVLMLKRKLKSNVITKEQAKDEAMRMRSGTDPMSSPVPAGGATTTGREELPIVTDERDPQESSLIVDSADCTSQNTTSSSPKAEPVTKTNAPPSSSTKLNDEVTMDYSRSIWTTIIQYLVAQLRSGEWEARHGSSLALRDLVRLHGESYGMHDNCTDSQNKRLHETALGSVAAVILEMLAQDRFGDFVGDQVVAPVREAGSQALASLMRHLDLRSVADIHSVLLHMILQEWISRKSAAGSINSPAIKHIWELRHAGLMGLKYELAVRPDLISGEVPGMNGDESKVYMDGVLQSSLLGLADADDDVRAVSAACLLPIANIITERLPPEGLLQLLDVLWNTFLEESDELNSSIASVMELLSRLLATPRVVEIYVKEEHGSRSLRHLIPRLFPYFRHTISTVRVSVVRTISAFLCAEKLPNGWITSQIMHLLFRNILLEERQDIRTPTIQAWNDALRLAKKAGLGKTWFEPFIQQWFNLALIPTIDGYPTEAFAAAELGMRRGTELHNVDKGVMSSDFSLVNEDMVFHNRIDAIMALAKIAEIGDANIVFTHLVSSFLMSTSSHQLTLCGIFVQEWAQVLQQNAKTSSSFVEILPDASCIVTALAELTERGTPEAYYEVTKDLTSIKQETAAIKLTLENSKKTSTAVSVQNGVTSLADVKNFIRSTFDELMQTSLRRSPLRQQLVDRKNGLATAVLQFENSRLGMDNRVATSAASALVWMRVIPPRLNPIIQNVMKGIKNESNAHMQERAANAIAVFIENCLDPKTSLPPTPVSKIINNLASFICQDSARTPSYSMSRTISGIYALQEERKLAENKKATSNAAQYAGVTFDDRADTACAGDGAERALQAVARLFGNDLFEKVPRLWEIISSALSSASTQDWGDLSTETAQDIIDCLTVLQVVLPNVSSSLHEQLSSLLLPLLDILRAPLSILRNVAAKTLAVMCEVMPSFGMLFVIENLLSLFGDTVSEANRSGAMEAIHYLVQRLQIKVLPYILFLIIPVLGRMSDGSADIRLLATSVFATLIKLMPLEEGIPDAEGLPPRLLAHREKEREFLKQLMNNRKVDPYIIPVNIKAELRPYQRDGVSWLAFLAKYQLHGILCDDMGLGKSLQTICIIASKHHERRLLMDTTGSSNAQALPSLIICPPTLIGHWYHEILKFAENLKPFKYFGSSKDRESLRGQLSRHDVIITSYEVIRADIDVLKRIPFLYCVLDEGHIIKNGKSKLSIAIKTLRSNHRIILSGTPIQNNVLELWNLFDFLMPGFLGSEKQFNDKFSKPILANREGKASSKQSEAATLALDALHKQVLPFLLRRLKEDVLDDLPPKIIQDYYCELSNVQKLLYDEFHVSRAAKGVQEVLVRDTDEPRKADNGDPEPQRHVFQTLQFLRKLCNHPLLAVNQDVAIYRQKVQEAWLKDKEHTPKDPFDLAHCPKLVALQQLLLDCGIGHDTDVADETSAMDTTANHRVLIFAQTKQMLDIIQKDLFAKVMPTVSFMRLDGSTEPLSRHDIVQTFNNDPSIDVLLLTTSVGGLGLTLTGADTVIFMDHDWNPMKDAQAMDRAHRIGQKKVVNVYRLITRGTLEEKIMSLQKFKLNIANTVVNEQNSGLDTMNTDQLLDLFDVDTGEGAKQDQSSHAGAHSTKPRALEGLANLPAEDEYESLSLDNFLSKF